MEIVNVASVHDVVAAIDVQRLAGDELGGVVSEKGRRGTDILDADETARGCLALRFFEQGVKFGNSRCCTGGERTGRNRVDTNAFRAELSGDVTYGRLQRRLC